MRKLLLACCVLALVPACSDTTTDADACRVFGEVDQQIQEFDPNADLDETTVERNRQWEFRLAQASVMATDHDLSVALRAIAYKASAAATGDEGAVSDFLTDATEIRQICQ